MAQQDAPQNVGSQNARAATVAAFELLILVKVPKANDAVLFYKAAFGAEEVVARTWNPFRYIEKLPIIISAELKISGVSVLISETTDVAASPVNAFNPTIPALVTADVEGAVAKAVSAGAVADGETVEEIVLDEGPFRAVKVKVNDPYGLVWFISSPLPSVWYQGK